MENLKPDRVFYYFDKLMKIPRPSGHEKQVSDFLVATGKELGLKTYQDESLNVIISRKASIGYEKAPNVTIQGHMDMVAAKEEGSDHDFTKDPLIPEISGKFLKAKGTSLGADNGIAVAMGLALMEDKNYKGPSLELLVTTEEETSMAGALNLGENILEGNYLINIDSEEEGVLTVGSAGGLTIFVDEEIGKQEENFGYQIKVSGLLGGHSGMQINEPRGNAVKILEELLDGFDLSIGEFYSGSLDNVIPSEGRVKVFGIDIGDLEKRKMEILDKHQNLLGQLKIEIVEAKGLSYSKDLSRRLIKLIKNLPTGVNSFMENGYTVESSNNLAFIKDKGGRILCEISLRSSNHYKLDDLTKKITKVLENNDFSYKIASRYPGWEYNKDSKLRPLAQKIYKQVSGKDFETIVIHAGLECGAIFEKYPNMDIISIGPDISGAHSIEEKVDVESVERVYKYIKVLLENIR